jgi:integrase
MKLTHKRERYQLGSLTIERRNAGSDVWVYRWREKYANGERVKRKRIIGTIDKYKTKSAAQRAVDGIRLDINATVAGTPTSRTVAEPHCPLQRNRVGEW